MVEGNSGREKGNFCVEITFCFTIGHFTYDNSIKVCMSYYTFCSWVSAVMGLRADDDDKLCFLLNMNENINMPY